MLVSFKWWFRRRQRILASRRGNGDVEKGTPLEKLAAVLHLKNKGGSSTSSSSSSGKIMSWECAAAAAAAVGYCMHSDYSHLMNLYSISCISSNQLYCYK